nr:SDR family oxidoreductase [Lachnospiraceae bacterium]
MKILITGSSRGIGRAAALRFLEEGHEVVGIDVLEPSIDHPRYTHFQTDVRDVGALPALEGVGVIFANAGRQNSGDDIGHDLVGAINVVEKYMHDPALRSVLFNASASAVSGQEFPEYAAAKA